LLERRLLRKETVGTQRFIMQLMRTVAAWAYVLCGLDNRFGWSRTYLAPVPTWLTLLAMACSAGLYILFVPVMNANRFAASIIRVETGQTVADSGPYRVVRHPMYAVGILVWFWTPLALGSFIALLAVVLIMLVFVWRLLNEEKILRKELPGYVEYCQRTPYRLIPFIW
jgi:protein-S-isoprenylcysteine O-methyltransferase Ste14